MNVLDLFSGIGLFSLGLERAGMRTIAFCEQAEFKQRVLRKRWPDTPLFNDVRELSRNHLTEPVDVISGGFPCQDISLAGRGAGIDGSKSSLWWEFHRLIEECSPRYAIIENSVVLRSRGLEVVLESLNSLGYDAEWHCIPASAIGAPHRRDRLWLIAYPRRDQADEGWPLFNPMRIGDRVQEGPICSRWDGSEHSGWWASEPGLVRVADGGVGRVDRLAALGDAVVPQIPEAIGRAILARAALTRNES